MRPASKGASSYHREVLREERELGDPAKGEIPLTAIEDYLIEGDRSAPARGGKVLDRVKSDWLHTRALVTAR